MSQTDVERFIERWRASAAAARANFQPFLGELCDVLGVERPQPAVADDARNAYVFERAVTFHNPDGTTSAGRIDLYKRGCFVLEAKQGSDSTPDEQINFPTQVRGWSPSSGSSTTTPPSRPPTAGRARSPTKRF
jgi:hypothetical protein